MKTIHLLKKLEQYPLFTENDVAKIIDKDSNYTKTLLYRLNKNSFIKRIEKGKYTVHEDPLIFSSHIATPSYLSLWTAFRFFNMTQQQPFGIFVVASASRRRIKLQNSEIMFFKTKHIFGYRKERYSDFDIFIAEKEKAIIDALLFKLPLNAILDALENDINTVKLAEYAKRTGNKSLIKRLGYILEHKKRNYCGLRRLDDNYVLLDYLGKRTGKRDKKWRIIVNAKI